VALGERPANASSFAELVFEIIQLERVERNKPTRPGFPSYTKASFELPEPVDFESAELARAAAEHDAQVSAQLEALAFLARKEATCFQRLDNVRTYCAIIEACADGSKPRLDILPRTHAWNAVDGAFGIQRRLIRHPDEDRLYAVVMDRDAISLRTLRVEWGQPDSGASRPALVADSAATVVEPVRQRLVRKRDRWVLLWSATANGPVHDTPVVVPAPALTPEEFLDRLYAAYEAELRSRVWRWRKAGTLADAHLFVSFNSFGGETVMAGPNDRGHIDPLIVSFPRVKEVVHGKTQKGWLPVVVSNVRYAGVRWMSLRAHAGGGGRPPDLNEARKG
jgi:hypothetical protein